eukprot:PITA_06869
MALVGECVETEPSSFQEAVQQPIWVDAMVEEYDSIVWNNVWDVVPRPENKSVVSSCWLYKVKKVADGSVEEHKARFVSRGFSQVEGIDYDDTFASVARYSSIRSMLALSTQIGWNIHQMDVNTTFINGKIEEEMYIEQPEGFETFDRESHVCQLKRALYGLKQAPCAWYTRIDNYFTGLDFTKSETNVNLYHIMVEGKQLIIVLYVNDLILTGDDQLMKDMGLMHYFIGMEVWQKDGEVFVSQGKYANEIIRRFHMEKCKPMQSPLADLCYAVNQLSQVVVQPTKLFWKAANDVFRYRRGTSQYGLWYRRLEGVKLEGFIDADWVGIPSDQKSTSRVIFNLGSAVVSWYNRKWRLVALSSSKVEYMAAS